MPRLRVNLLGRTLVEVDGREAGLTPIAKAVLIRLVFAQGSAVFPDDKELASSVEALRARLRARIGNQVFRHDFTDHGTAVAITTGDLFAQDGANLVVGFTDTFDTTVDHDLINGTDSVQRQLVRRLYGDDRGQLDRDLRSALRHVAPEHVENRSAKRLGKLTRYPVGTVAALHHAERRIFAVASSRMGNDLVVHASLPDLLRGLAGLWDTICVHGRLKPVAIPLADWGLARSYGVSDESLLAIIIESFVARSRDRFICPELHVVSGDGMRGRHRARAQGRPGHRPGQGR
jgi:hypothetical protein